jgi:hypothetical protein
LILEDLRLGALDERGVKAKVYRNRYSILSLCKNNNQCFVVYGAEEACKSRSNKSKAYVYVCVGFF